MFKTSNVNGNSRLSKAGKKKGKMNSLISQSGIQMQFSNYLSGKNHSEYECLNFQFLYDNGT